MEGSIRARIAKVERIKAFNKAAAKNLAIKLASDLETAESRNKARRELLSVMETLAAAERELAELKAKLI
jgi:hypothetical protein